MMWKINVLGLALWAAGLVACGRAGDGTAEDIRRWVGMRLEIPADMAARADGRDTLLSPGDTAGVAKVLVYYSAEGCTPCKLKELMQWRPMIEELAEDSAVRFVFILNPAHTTERELEMTLYGMRFVHPVFYDRANEFEISNPELPKNPVFQTFLLDSANRVMLVGSPVGNAKMWELYKRTIAGMTAE
ncbi:hypothetical protein [uncultured Rikenella sp.]|uniref:hypothetical protein n=1 Tax=uncultured Rikenella sp. TaxID=368003 RepID=UPI00260220B9|nr:hypothetical protein [uncultured Rikenella sp.]